MNPNEPSAPYYTAYERRYRAVYAAGAKFWGHTPDDAELCAVLERWVAANIYARRK